MTNVETYFGGASMVVTCNSSELSNNDSLNEFSKNAIFNLSAAIALVIFCSVSRIVKNSITILYLVWYEVQLVMILTTANGSYIFAQILSKPPNYYK